MPSPTTIAVAVAEVAATTPLIPIDPFHTAAVFKRLVLVSQTTLPARKDNKNINTINDLIRVVIISQMVGLGDKNLRKYETDNVRFGNVNRKTVDN